MLLNKAVFCVLYVCPYLQTFTNVTSESSVPLGIFTAIFV